jgi:hypothetical protein
MNSKRSMLLGALCTVVTAGVWAVPANAQMAEVKEKPRMYTYAASWTIPRARWAEMDKAVTADQKILDKAIASGTLVGYGDDTNLVHQPEGATHGNWWSSMSMAGLLNVLDEVYKSGNATAPVLAGATKHADYIVVSRYYNWRAGTWRGVYSHGSSYKLKADAPDDAVDLVSKNVIAPMMEKLLADGTIYEYEVDVEAIHTEAPGTFWVFYLAANAEGIDKVNAALRDTMKKNPLVGTVMGSIVDWTPHRDTLNRSNAVYK